MLERLWNKGNLHTLLVEMQVGTATMQVPYCFITGWRFLKKAKNRSIIWPSNPNPKHIRKENHNSKRHMQPTLTAAVFTIVRTRKQPKCSSAEEWRNKMWCMHSHKKEQSNAICSNMDGLETVIPSEVSQTQTNVISPICGIWKKGGANVLTYKTDVE